MMTNEEIAARLNTFEDELKKTVRRLKAVQKSLDLLYDDGNLLEDIQESLRTVQGVVRQAESSLKNVVREEVGEVASAVSTVENKVDKKMGQTVKKKHWWSWGR